MARSNRGLRGARHLEPSVKATYTKISAWCHEDEGGGGAAREKRGSPRLPYTSGLEVVFCYSADSAAAPALLFGCSRAMSATGAQTRTARDGKAYPYCQFIEFYGEELGATRWAEAAPVDPGLFAMVDPGPLPIVPFAGDALAAPRAPRPQQLRIGPGLQSRPKACVSCSDGLWRGGEERRQGG